MMSSGCVELPDEGAVTRLTVESGLCRIREVAKIKRTRFGQAWKTYKEEYKSTRDKPTTTVDRADSEMRGILVFFAPSVTRASVGDIPRGAMIGKKGWKRRAVPAVRDFPPGGGPARLRDRPLALVKIALF
ncbi:hypothetical protein L1987_30307 [Smallanthus sonchifolius]|uniref:Uncharacterized protein n=1 Tax=Smallanthus sonchifolius TaxID=185202 RepID=A0ACB9I289_9ASTR|nr:hypothetical protein L1987_30307 [Smallanthus sonchifolius]